MPTGSQPALQEQSEPAVEPEPKPEPEVIKPAGPMLEKPKPAKLSGPTVVRVESVDEDVRRRPDGRRGGHKPRAKSPTTAAPLPSVPAGPVPGKGKKAGKIKTHGRRKDSGDEGVRRSRGTDLKRVRLRDLEERQARLAAAGGASKRAKPSRRIEARPTMPATVERPERRLFTNRLPLRTWPLAVKTGDIITKLLMSQGILATANQTISTEAAELVALEFELAGLSGSRPCWSRLKNICPSSASASAKTPSGGRCWGMDHGKTSLLDRIENRCCCR